MRKLISFVRLDFVTVKPYFTVKNMLIYTLIALFSALGSGRLSGISIGMMLGTLFISYPFAAGEKSNMDALYVTLSLNRKTVVLGRYLFILLLNASIILFVLVTSSAGLLVARIAGGGENGGGGAPGMTAFLAVLFIIIQSLQLPVFFKLSYTKAKFVALAPFAVIMSGYVGFTTLARDSAALSDFSEFLSTLNQGAVPALTALALILILYASYTVSLAFYKKREF
ncbi:MAG: ABC-2 transporter permease [Oscillospiraceae bacterium]|nr:ABC-2 transporter permease [Oscillospiraceae bacterium]